MVSVKHLPLPRVQAQVLLRSLFPRRFLVSQGMLSSGSVGSGLPLQGSTGSSNSINHELPEQWCYMILLPPQHHLLLRCVLRDACADIHVATDAWGTLAFLEAELQARTDNMSSTSA